MNPQSVPRLPALGEYVPGAGRLIDVVSSPPPPPPPPRLQYVFESVSACAELRLNGEQLVNLARYEEVGEAPGSATRHATDVAKRFAKRHSLGAESELEVVVVEYQSSRSMEVDVSRLHDCERAFVAFMPGADSETTLRGKWSERVVWNSRSAPQ